MMTHFTPNTALRWRSLLAFAWLLGLPCAHATPDAGELALQQCRYIEDPQLRLRCFDQATGGPLLPGQTPADAEPVQMTQDEDRREPGQGLQLFRGHPDQTLSWLDQRWELSPQAKRGTFQVRPYQPVYLLPIFLNSNPNTRPDSPNPANRVTVGPENLDSNEMKFQLSLKTKVVENLFGDNGDVWFGYTQSSRWQTYNTGLSRPFRETNYEPEVMFTWRNSWQAFKDATGWDPKLLGVSLNHQSNGRALPLSRSWNRVMGIVGLERENTLVQFRPWMRISEPSATDDNPDISDYLGRGDLLVVHKVRGHELSALVRHNFRGGDQSRGGVQLDWGIPLRNNLRGHIQYFSGYGESLIDYNHRSDYLGVGFSLVGWY